MGTGSMSHVKVCVSVCVRVALQRFLGNYGIYRLQIVSVDRHQRILEEERKKNVICVYIRECIYVCASVCICLCVQQTYFRL